MNPSLTTDGRKAPTISWPMLITAALVLIGSLGLLSHGVLYTQGEVVEGLFAFLVGSLIVIVLLTAACGARRAAMWLLLGVGGCLLLWQCRQHQRWLSLHEEVLGVIRHVAEERKQHGAYPADLSAYHFTHPEFADHLGYGRSGADSFGLTYFLNDSHISYWYYSDSGFGYYPD